MTRRTALAYDRATATELIAAAPAGATVDAHLPVDGELRLYVRQEDGSAPDGGRRLVGRYSIADGLDIADRLAVTFGGQVIRIDTRAGRAAADRLIERRAPDDIEGWAAAYRAAREHLAAALRASTDSDVSLVKRSGLARNTVRAWRAELTSMPVGGEPVEL